MPTSLWVDAKVCYAKQMVFEKDIEKAIEILREICLLIPPMPIEDLSFINQDNISFSKKSGKNDDRLKNSELGNRLQEDKILKLETEVN